MIFSFKVLFEKASFLKNIFVNLRHTKRGLQAM